MKKENLRDNMTTIENALNSLAEAAATELSKSQNPKGFEGQKKVNAYSNVVITFSISGRG
ncbi:MAG: hypothetical protein IKR41_00375 [Bacteroidales bacterium]|nr:hypothetical protein [Bacteroidales bacterium]